MRSYCPETNVKHTTRAGKLWHAINLRCKPGGAWQKKDPCYIGCRNTFKDFQSFVDWCQLQPGYLEREENGNFWSLDKDLKGGISEYGTSTCMFVPNRVNGLLVGLKVANHLGMLGTTVYKGDRWRGQGKDWTGRKVHLGVFHSEREAHRAWQRNKLQAIQDFCENDLQVQQYHNIVQALSNWAKDIESDILNDKETRYA